MEDHGIATQDQEFIGMVARFTDCSKIEKSVKQKFIEKPQKLDLSTLLNQIYTPKPVEVKKWREENGLIYLPPLTSNGRTGEEWIKSLKKGGHTVTDYAKSILRSPDFHPTNGITYEIAVLKGELFTDDNRITKNIRKEAQERGFSTPNAEVACLIREKFSDKELEAMGLIWIVTMHDPIKDSGGDPRLLSADRYCGGSGLSASYGGPDGWGSRKSGFAFAVSQVPL